MLPSRIERQEFYKSESGLKAIQEIFDKLEATCSEDQTFAHILEEKDSFDSIYDLVSCYPAKAFVDTFPKVFEALKNNIQFRQSLFNIQSTHLVKWARKDPKSFIAAFPNVVRGHNSQWLFQLCLIQYDYTLPMLEAFSKIPARNPGQNGSQLYDYKRYYFNCMINNLFKPNNLFRPKQLAQKISEIYPFLLGGDIAQLLNKLDQIAATENGDELIMDMLSNKAFPLCLARMLCLVGPNAEFRVYEAYDLKPEYRDSDNECHFNYFLNGIYNDCFERRSYNQLSTEFLENTIQRLTDENGRCFIEKLEEVVRNNPRAKGSVGDYFIENSQYVAEMKKSQEESLVIRAASEGLPETFDSPLKGINSAATTPEDVTPPAKDNTAVSPLQCYSLFSQPELTAKNLVKTLSKNNNGKQNKANDVNVDAIKARSPLMKNKNSAFEQRGTKKKTGTKEPSNLVRWKY